MTSAVQGTVIFRSLLVLLVLAPLPLGAIPFWAQALLMFTVFAMLAGWALGPNVRSECFSPNEEKALKLILSFWASASLIAFFQIVPLPPSFIAFLSPGLHDLYDFTLPIYEPNVTWRALSTTPAATIQSALLITVTGACFFLV